MTPTPIAASRDHLELFTDLERTRHIALIGPDTTGKRNLLRHFADAAMANDGELFIVDVNGTGPLADYASLIAYDAYARRIDDAARLLDNVYSLMDSRMSLLAKHSVYKVSELPVEARPDPLTVIICDVSRVTSSETRTGQATAFASERLLQLLRKARCTGISVVFAAATERFSDAKAPGKFTREALETYLFGEWSGERVRALGFTPHPRLMVPNEDSCLWAGSSGQLHNIVVAPRLDTGNATPSTTGPVIPLEQSLLIAGRAGSGKTVFMEQRARDAVAAGYDVVFIGNPNHPRRNDELPDSVTLVYDELAALEALTRVVNSLDERERLLRAESVWTYADVQTTPKPAPVLIAVEEFAALLATDPSLEGDFVPSEFTTLRQTKQEIGHRLGSLLRAARDLGVTVLLSAQQVHTSSGRNITGFSSVAGLLGAVHLGSPTVGEQLMMFGAVELPESPANGYRFGLYKPPRGPVVELTKTH